MERVFGLLSQVQPPSARRRPRNQAEELPAPRSSDGEEVLVKWVFKFNPWNPLALDREFERIAEKHGVEEPPRFMPTLDDLDLEDDDDER